MGRPLRIEYPGAVYHITSRGNERKDIFLDDRDRVAFLEILKDYHERFGIIIHSYVLMDNHYHIILETPKGNLLKVMHGINSRYTGYFNRKYSRSGHLFQGRYKAILVDKDIYLVELSRYIHLNPVRAKVVKKPEKFRWSSYRGYIGNEKEEVWMEYAWVLSKFAKRKKTSRQRYREYVEKEMGGEQKNPFADLFGQVILGGAEFRRKIKKMLKRRAISQEIVERRRLEETAEPEEIIEEVARVFKVDSDTIKGKGKRENTARAAAMFIMQRYSGLSNVEIGKIFGGIHYSAVSKASSRFHEKIRSDRKLSKLVKKVISHVKT
jgi:REP element-mobilizing transposase RayT